MKVLKSFHGFKQGDVLTVRPDLASCGDWDFSVLLVDTMREMAGLEVNLYKPRSWMTTIVQDKYDYLWSADMFLDPRKQEIDVSSLDLEGVFA